MDHYDFNTLLDRCGLDLKVYPGDLLQIPIYVLFEHLINKIEEFEMKKGVGE